MVDVRIGRQRQRVRQHDRTPSQRADGEEAVHRAESERHAAQRLREYPARPQAPINPTLNTYYQGLLGNSVFRYYRLNSTQWTTGGAPQGTPANLANIVIETYVQSVSTSFDPKKPKGTQITGCLACHLHATAANNTTVTDHSFLFLEAK